MIGGAAGAVPPLVAWAAVTGGLEGSALYLFAIVFYWTPPHFWALSLLMKDEYAKAGVPMLPVVRGERETRRQILLYTILLVAVTLLPFAGRLFDGLYLAAALGLGARVHRLRARRSSAAPTAAGRSAPTSSRWPTSRCCSARWWPTPGCSAASPAVGTSNRRRERIRLRAHRCPAPSSPPFSPCSHASLCAPVASANWGHRGHRPDFAYNVLPPGQFGGLPVGPQND